MQKINLLPSEIYNKISAGEVVENPASIVKELVENSIDAGSNNIIIEVVDGGITSILVSDNGHGISKDYIKQAFLPHATSKIATSDDLENIATLGFRGEALPSIAAISSVEIKTRAVDENTGVKYSIKGGVSGEVSEIDRNFGTTIVVRNIFFNTPARQKFLRKPKSEEHEITAIIQGLILANPNVAIRYIADGKVIFHSNGKGLENALYSIYPTDITKHLIYIEGEKYNINVKGYIGLPTLTKSNRNYQTTIVNGRLIRNSTISTAVSEAYGNMLMKRSFPVFCLEIIMPFDMLDVNVTPSKTDVRFADSRSVFSSVYRAVQDGLSGNRQFFGSNESETIAGATSEIAATHNLEKIESEGANNSINNANLENFTQNNYDLEGNSNKNLQFESVFEQITAEKNYSDNSTNITNNDNNIKDSSSDLLKRFNEIKSDKPLNIPNNSAIFKANDTHAGGINFKLSQTPIVQSNLFDEIEEEFSMSHRIVGQIFNCYLIVAKGNEIYLIDQHATHERLIYDKLIAQIEEKNIAVQPLLTSQIIQLSAKDSEIIENMLPEIRKIGFDIEEFGNYTFKINSIPVVFPTFNGYKFINSLLEEKNYLKKIELKDVLHNEIAKKACKSAIKAGQKLKDIEILDLIDKIEENKPTQCPHGRPTIIKFTKKDIDKLFKRIL